MAECNRARMSSDHWRSRHSRYGKFIVPPSPRSLRQPIGSNTLAGSLRNERLARRWDCALACAQPFRSCLGWCGDMLTNVSTKLCANKPPSRCVGCLRPSASGYVSASPLRFHHAVCLKWSFTHGRPTCIQRKAQVAARHCTHAFLLFLIRFSAQKS